MVHVWVLLLKCHHFRFSWQPRSGHKWLERLDNSLRIIRRPSCELALFKCSLLPSVLASGWSRYAAIKHIVRQHKYTQSLWKIRARKSFKTFCGFCFYVFSYQWIFLCIDHGPVMKVRFMRWRSIRSPLRSLHRPFPLLSLPSLPLSFLSSSPHSPTHSLRSRPLLSS